MKFVIANPKKFNNRLLLSKEVKEKWLKSLKSGDYQKGESVLCYENKYCCLGVLCEIENYSKIKSMNTVFYENSKSVFPYINKEIFDVLGSLGTFQGYYVEINDIIFNSLAHVNDATISFKEVIEIIEKYF